MDDESLGDFLFLFLPIENLNFGIPSGSSCEDIMELYMYIHVYTCTSWNFTCVHTFILCI